MNRSRNVWTTLLATLAVLLAGLIATPTPALAAGPAPTAGTWKAEALPVTAHVRGSKATPTSKRPVARGTAVQPLADSGPEGIPTVALGASPAGYLPLDRFGIAPTPVDDEEFVEVTTPALGSANRTYTSISVASNGFLKVGGDAGRNDLNCCNIPSGPDPQPPNGFVAPFWSDLTGTGAPGIFTGTITDGVSSWVVVEWRVYPYGGTKLDVFQAWLGVNGVEDISMVYDQGNLPKQYFGAAFLVGAENSLWQGQASQTEPTTDLRVTSTIPVAAASVQPVSGSGQTAESGQAFAAPLVASVTGSDGQPFVGGPVTFTGTSGSASFAGGSPSATATTGSDGRATSPTLFASGPAGPVTVTARALYATSATFSLNVTRTPAAISAVSGGGQSAAAGSRYAQPLVAQVVARDQQPLAGAPVTFTVTAGSATFGGSSSATATTGGDGRATAPTLTAGASTGPVTVTASTPGVSATATYSLTVTAASADLSAALSVPTSAVRPGVPFTVTLVVRNAGPSTATTVASGIALPESTRVVDGRGGAVSRDGRAVGFVRSSLAAGQSVTYTVQVRADGGNGSRTLTAVTASTQVRDPATANNATRATVAVRR